MDTKIYWTPSFRDGKLDEVVWKWLLNEWREDWMLSLAWSQISEHSTSLLWHWRCPRCWKDVVTQRVMFLDCRAEVGINLGGKLRFQRAISFVWAKLTGTPWSGPQRCLGGPRYRRKQTTSIYNTVQLLIKLLLIRKSIFLKFHQIIFQKLRFK